MRKTSEITVTYQRKITPYEINANFHFMCQWCQFGGLDF